MLSLRDKRMSECVLCCVVFHKGGVVGCELSRLCVNGKENGWGVAGLDMGRGLCWLGCCCAVLLCWVDGLARM